MLIGLTHFVSPKIIDCELTYIGREPIAYDLIVRQYENYKALLAKCDVKMTELSDNIAYPDSCFIEDTAIVVDEIAIITSMGVASRRNETHATENALAKHREIARIHLPATIEGGDVLQIGKRIFVGLSSRTNAMGIAELARILEPIGYHVVPIIVSGSLHFKTSCTAINDETLLVNPLWIDLEPLKGFNLIPVSEDERWAANVLRIGETVCVQSGFPRTLEMVGQLCNHIETLDISEFRKAEAGLTCLSLLFQDLTH